MNFGDLPASTLMSWVFLAGSAWSQFRSSKASLRDQGKRLGALEQENVALKLRVEALERARNGQHD
jgi:hypothetical protein